MGGPVTHNGPPTIVGFFYHTHTHTHIVRKSPETIEYNTLESHTVDLVDWVCILLY